MKQHATDAQFERRAGECGWGERLITRRALLASSRKGSNRPDLKGASPFECFDEEA